MVDKPTYGELEQRVREMEKSESKRRQDERSLQRQVLHHDILMDVSLDGIAIIDQEHRVVESNKRFAEMLGYTPEEVLSLHTWDWEAIMTEAEIRANFADLTKTKTTFETRHRRKDGTTYHAEVTACGAKVGDESMVLTITRDISDRKEAESALKESESRYRALFENMNDAVAIYEAVDDGADFLFVDFNEAAERIENIRKEALLGRRVTDVFSGVKEFGLLDVFRRVWKTGRSEHHPVSMYKDERIVGWRENFVYKLPSEEIVSIYSDETRRKQAEEALRESEARLRSIFNTSSDAILVFNADGDLVMTNPAAARIYGYSHEKEMVGLKGRDIVHPEYHHLFSAFIRECSETGHFRTESVDVRKDGSAFNVEVQGSLFEYKGEQHFLAIVRDITLRKQAEEALRESEEKLRIRNRIASVFLTKTD